MNKNEKIRSALSDITLIKQTIGKSRAQIKRLSNVLFLYGGVQLFLSVGYIIVWYFARNISVSLTTFLWVNNLIYLLIAVFYFIWRYELKRTENNYTLYLYDTWGYALFVIPMLWLSVLLIITLCPNTFENTVVEQGTMLLLFLAQQMMFFIALAVTGFLLNSEDWKILSVVFICLYFLSFLVFGRISDTSNVGTFIGAWVSIQFFWSAICPLISLVLGAYFKLKKNWDK
ncbi:MAG: hypothetical protein IJW55_01490 [Clostridia bacterium]|nr:hypothetical protein [Clostridia bacterium]